MRCVAHRTAAHHAPSHATLALSWTWTWTWAEALTWAMTRTLSLCLSLRLHRASSGIDSGRSVRGWRRNAQPEPQAVAQSQTHRRLGRGREQPRGGGRLVRADGSLLLLLLLLLLLFGGLGREGCQGCLRCLRDPLGGAARR